MNWWNENSHQTKTWQVNVLGTKQEQISVVKDIIREDLLAKVQLPIITCFILPDSGLLKEWQIQSCYRGGSPDHRCFLHMKCFMLLPIKKLSL